jgi:hypothetical protein
MTKLHTDIDALVVELEFEEEAGSVSTYTP